MLPALQNKQLDFVISNAATIIQARDQGMDMRVVAGFANSLEEGYDVNRVLVRSDEGFDTGADLEDTTVAANALRDQGGLALWNPWKPTVSTCWATQPDYPGATYRGEL